jgi:RNA polymerase sigma-70 factor (ECF subfamily)
MLDRQTVEESQAQLLYRIAAQDRDALAEFYDQTAAPLFSLSVRILGDTAEAEEVIQDVFVQIWEKAATFDATLGAPFHWALSLARHRSIDRLRARQRRARLLDDLQEFVADPPPSQEPAGGQPALTGEEAAGVRKALSSLPADQRRAIELAFFRGSTHQEIAEELGEPLGTIKARIRRGMLKLRDLLQDYT